MNNPLYVALRSDPDYDYDILPQEYYANGGQWRKRSSIGQKPLGMINKLNPLEEIARRRRNRNKELAVKYYPVFFP